ncbi:MAG: hypothetical protein HY801_14280 [Candidatus Lindowbacteria bacterium]|nr:hypothetical protein [Candidatus Lindowbacteria bacterium]
MSLITISIKRFDPATDAAPRWVDYKVPAGERATVLETLMNIYESLDPALAFRFGCRFNKCGLCAVEVNGRPRMGCFTEVKDGMRIAPLAGMPVVRDMVIDRTAFFETLRELQLFIPEWKTAAQPQTLIEPEEHAKLVGCLECLACNATCPKFDFNSEGQTQHKGTLPLASFPGPYVFVKLAQLHFDPRNTLDRRQQAQDLGISACSECGKCYCIHGINIRRDAIGALL